MATVIDQFIVELGIDPKKMTDGQKAVVDSFKKTTDEAVKSSKNLEVATGKVSDQLSNATRAALGFFAAFVGARSLTDFVTNVISADAAVARFSENLGVAPQTLSAWGQVAAQFGGSMQGFEGTLSRVQQMLYNNSNGIARLPDAFGRLASRAKMSIDYSGDSIKTLTQELLALAKIHNDPKLGGPMASHGLAQELGIDAGLENAAYEQGANLPKYIADQQKKNALTDEDYKKAKEVAQAYTDLWQSTNKLMGDIVRTFEPQLLKGLDELNKDLPQLKTEITGLVTEADRIAKAFGGWKNVVEGLVAAFAALKVLQVASMVANIAGALRVAPVAATVAAEAAPAAAAAAGGGGLLAVVGGWLGLAAGATGLAASLTLGGHGERKAIPDDKVKQLMDAQKASYSGDPQPDYNSLTRDRDAHGAALDGDITADGRPISKANPLPVTITDKPTDKPGILETLGNAAKNLFGFGGGSSPGGGPTQDTAPGAPLRAVGPSAGERGWWTKERQQHAYDRLRKESGFNDLGAKAAVSRWMNVEAGGGPSSANNVGGGHFGIGQWSRSRGRSIWGNPDFDAQLSLAIKEFNGSEKKAGDVLRNARHPDEAATGMSMYERAEGYKAETGRDFFTGKTLGGMSGIDRYIRNGAMPASNSSSSSVSSVVHLNGPIAIHTQATDAPGIASALGQSLQQKVAAQMVNGGMN
jgi:hypothetical protein